MDTRTRKAGRPRDERLDEAIQKAALETFQQRGYVATSLSEVARRAGVGTPALYRRWPTKAAMAIDLIVAELGPESIPDTGSIRDDLAEFTRLRLKQFSKPLFQQLLLPVVAEARMRPALRDTISARFAEFRRPVVERLRRRIAAGELRADADPIRILDLLSGPLTMAMIFGLEMPKASEAESIVDQVLEGVAPTPS